LRQVLALAVDPQTIYKQLTAMETVQALKRQRKDDLIEKLVTATNALKGKDEELLGAAVIGVVVGFLVGRGW